MKQYSASALVLGVGLFASPVVGVLAVGGLGTSSAQAAVVYFSDGFEAQTDPLGSPPTGLAWRDIGLGNNHALTTSPVFAGNQALEVIRNGTTDVPALIGVGTSGGLVAGNVIEYVFHINQVTNTAPDPDISHNFNGPIQINIGFSSGATLASFGALNGGLETYHVSDFGSPTVNTGVVIPRNTAAYDAIRLVLTLTNPSPATLGGTYEVFIDTDDADGIATTSRGVYDLTPQTIPASESTNPSFRIARGPSTSISLYDDISISQVPEPASLIVALMGGSVMLGRSRRPS